MKEGRNLILLSLIFLFSIFTFSLVSAEIPIIRLGVYQVGGIGNYTGNFSGNLSGSYGYSLQDAYDSGKTILSPTGRINITLNASGPPSSTNCFSIYNRTGSILFNTCGTGYTTVNNLIGILQGNFTGNLSGSYGYNETNNVTLQQAYSNGNSINVAANSGNFTINVTNMHADDYPYFWKSFEILQENIPVFAVTTKASDWVGNSVPPGVISKTWYPIDSTSGIGGIYLSGVGLYSVYTYSTWNDAFFHGSIYGYDNTTSTLWSDPLQEPSFNLSSTGVFSSKYGINVIGNITSENYMFAKNFTLLGSEGGKMLAMSSVGVQTASIEPETGNAEFMNLTINNSICDANSGSCYNLTDLNFTITDTWKLNYTFYYTKTQTDTNFSLYYLKSNPSGYLNLSNISTILTNVAMTNQSNEFPLYQNFTNVTIAGVFYYYSLSACNLTINHSDCTNSSGRYIVG